MSILEKIEFIDFFLSMQEDFLHKKEGDDCTTSRVYLQQLKEALDRPACVHPYSMISRGVCMGRDKILED